MYEQYTDKQIVEMLIPKLNKATGHDWNDLFEYPKVCADMIKAISLAYRSGYVRGQLGRSFIIGGKKVNKKKAKEPVNTFKVGDKVKFLGLNFEGKEALNNNPFYPPVNTVGKVAELGPDYCFVQWPDGTTVGDDIWACRNNYLEKVIEHWVPATRDNVKIGSKIRFVNEQLHKKHPQYFPCKGTVGEVRTICKDGFCDVQWPKGTTSDMDWWVTKWEDLEALLCE